MLGAVTDMTGEFFGKEIIVEKWPLGVFASIDAGLGIQLDVAQELGISTVQLYRPSRSYRTLEQAKRFLEKLQRRQITITAVFGGFDGESYQDIPTVAKTVGLVPAEMRSERLVEMKEIADFSHQLGVQVVALHLGFIPLTGDRVAYDGVVEVTRQLCDHCAALGQNLHLETGQETAEHLLEFLQDTRRGNLFINFDPANMILYGTGEPIAALETLGAYVRSVHFKDALWSDQPGVTWGQEVPLGEGDVGMERYLCTLDQLGYRGPLTVEREIPEEPERQRQEVGQAIDLLGSLREKLAT